MKNWKTTLLGALVGTLQILQATVAAYQAGTPVDWLKVSLGIAWMIFGLVMKDFDVTGVGSSATRIARTTLVSLGVFMLVGCGATVSNPQATTTDGKRWQFCVEVTQPIFSLAWDEVACSPSDSVIAAKELQYKAMYPAATVTRKLTLK